LSAAVFNLVPDWQNKIRAGELTTRTTRANTRITRKQMNFSVSYFVLVRVTRVVDRPYNDWQFGIIAMLHQ
jgi:hypothetical protein